MFKFRAPAFMWAFGKNWFDNYHYFTCAPSLCLMECLPIVIFN